MPSGAGSTVSAQLQPLTFHAAFIQAQDITHQRFHPFNRWTPSHSSIICQLGWKKVINENENVQDLKRMVQFVISVSIFVMLLVSSLPSFKAQRKKSCGARRLVRYYGDLQQCHKQPMAALGVAPFKWGSHTLYKWRLREKIGQWGFTRCLGRQRHPQHPQKE